jgi:uncharacterized membrane protein YqaE (UPF0057 family)
VAAAKTDILPLIEHPLGSKNMDILRIILAIIIPPVGAFMAVGLTLHFWINLLLCILLGGVGVTTAGVGFVGWLVPVIHALWLVMKK